MRLEDSRSRALPTVAPSGTPVTLNFRYARVCSEDRLLAVSLSSAPRTTFGYSRYTYVSSTARTARVLGASAVSVAPAATTTLTPATRETATVAPTALAVREPLLDGAAAGVPGRLSWGSSCLPRPWSGRLWREPWRIRVLSRRAFAGSLSSSGARRDRPAPCSEPRRPGRGAPTPRGHRATRSGRSPEGLAGP